MKRRDGQWDTVNDVIMYSTVTPHPPPSLPFTHTGHCGVHQEGVRQEIQPDMALHRGPQLWIVRDARDPPLYLLLLGTGGHPAVQERLSPVRRKLGCHLEEMNGGDGRKGRMDGWMGMRRSRTRAQVEEEYRGSVQAAAA